MYKVVVKFADLQDSNHLYEVGDIYPRVGVSPTPERVAELASNKNRLHAPLIEEVSSEPMKYHNTKVGKIGSETPVEKANVEEKADPVVKKRKKQAE